jgi:surfeit locus 1 family protein
LRLNFKFWLITVVTLLALLSTLALGRWQLSRAAQKEAIQTSMDAQAQREPLALAALTAQPDQALIMHRSVRLQGQWLPEHTVFLDNRQMNNKPGLYVVTPLRLQDSGAVVLVQRGWVARNFLDRTSLPVLDTPSGTVSVLGRIAPPPSKLYALGGAELGRIRQNIDLSQFSAELNMALLPFSIQQRDASGNGLLRDWPLPATGVEKHVGYAFQWFALSALIALLYVWFQIVRRFITPRRG